MTTIDPLAVIGVAARARSYNPPKPPIGLSAGERQAFYTGWREAHEHLLDEVIREFAPATAEKYGKYDGDRYGKFFVIPHPEVAPFGGHISKTDVQAVWDAYVKPTQTDDAAPQSVETRTLMAVLRSINEGIPE